MTKHTYYRDAFIIQQFCIDKSFLLCKRSKSCDLLLDWMSLANLLFFDKRE